MPMFQKVTPWEGHNIDVLFNQRGAADRRIPILECDTWRLWTMAAALIAAGVLLGKIL